MNYDKYIKECVEEVSKLKKEIHMMRTSIGTLERTMQTREIFSDKERFKLKEAIDVLTKAIEFNLYLIEEWQKREKEFQKKKEKAEEIRQLARELLARKH